MIATMRRIAVLLGIGLLVAGPLISDLVSTPARAGARNPCLEPGNLTHNCGFDVFEDQWRGGRRVQVPQGWHHYILNGEIDFLPHVDTYWGAPSLAIGSNGVPFAAGIYQQVQVTPGVVYQADAGWAAVMKTDFERKLGLDPTGGTDPQAPTVVWGPAEWAINPWPDLTVSTRATGPTMTVFVWTNHQKTYGDDWIFVDAVGLWPDTSQPAATLTPSPSPTPTRKPPTRTPSPVPHTATPTEPPASPTPTDTAVPTATPTPTHTATHTPTPTITPTWTPTPTPAPPTATPLPTRTALPTIVPVAMAVPNSGGDSDSGEQPTGSATSSTFPGLLLVAGGALLVGMLVVVVALWLWLRNQRADLSKTEAE